LVGTGYIGASYQGQSVALSADGNTAVVGGYGDNSNRGAVWVYTRSGTTWTQQGSKLVGTGVPYPNLYVRQGWSVAVSADGNTIITGAYEDSLEMGAAWIFVRTGQTWAQQGHKLVGTGAVGFAAQGYSVAISADGNTAIVGGYGDNSVTGACWVYTRSGNVWTQQGSKLVGTGGVGVSSFGQGPEQGYSVALSADGNTAIIGAPNDSLSNSSYEGAVWIFIRSGGVWTQQGPKIAGTGYPQLGISVTLSADGNTALVEGTGAVWIYNRSGSIWNQSGPDLVGSGTGLGTTHSLVAVSSDGTTAILGQIGSNNPSGAAWIFVGCNTCGPDTTVWPGDADANHIVDNNDLLPIGLAYDSIGPVRAVQNIVWQGDVATDWNDTLPGYSPAVNFKNADCDGNGMVNADDTLAIALNFGLTHAKTNNLPGPWRSGMPGITLQFSQDTVYNNDTVTVGIYVGSSAVPVSDIYGLAFTFNYDPLVVDSNYSMFNFIPSWLGTGTNSININRNFIATGQVKAAITGIDHSPRSGYGQIATFRCIITTDNINGKDYSYYNNLNYISDITAIDQYGNHIPLNAGIDSNEVGFFLNGIRDISQATKISVYPNPAANQVRIKSASGMTTIRIIDIVGNEVLTLNSDNKLSQTIDISRLAVGIYTIHASSQAGAGTAKLIISR
jgi:hypothetical protein